MRNFIAVLLVASTTSLFSQITQSVEAEIEGGKAALEQVLNTQLSLPKILLTKSFNEEIIIYFEVDSLNNATKLTFKNGMNNLLRIEMVRILGFLNFQRKNALNETAYEYYLQIKLNSEKYHRFLKQKQKHFVKNKAADSSMVVNLRADKSPEYYKNGDEGLAEYILSNIEYPPVAREKSIEGTVIIEFIVETNGFVTNLKIKQGVTGGCSEEAVRLIKDTKWQPAELNGKTVRYRMSYPITFNLKTNFRDYLTPRQEPY
jgi:TonB family protein